MAAASSLEQLRQRVDRRSPRRVDRLGGAERRRELGRAGNPACDLEIGGIVAVLAGDEDVLSGLGRCEEVPALAAAHHPRLGFDLIELQATALEDAVVGLRVQIEAPVEPLFVAIEAVGVLHDELTRADQAGAWARLVPILRLEVVEHLRQVAIRPDLTPMERDRLLVRQRQYERAPVAVGQLEEFGNAVASGGLPELGRRQHRHEELLGADRVHLFADDLDDVLVHPPAEWEKGPDPRADLADEPAAHEQLVADRVGVRGVLPQGRDEQLRRSHYSRGTREASAMANAAGLAIFKRFGRAMPSAIQRSISWKSSSTRMSEETFFSTRPWA